MTDKLIDAVEAFARVTWNLSEDELDRPWRWRAYDQGVRYAFMRTYEQLRQLAAELLSRRATGEKTITTAQRSLGQYHSAYRDLQAVLLGVDDDLLDVSPDKETWPLRMILGHIIAAEREYFSRIWHAVEQFRQEVEQPEEMSTEAIEEFVGSYDDFERMVNRLSLAGILAYYDSLHKRVIREIADIRGFELEAPSLWWEEAPMPVEFRLHRLDSHLRQRTVQIELLLEGLGQPPGEAKRLLRLVYAALAEVEGMIIGDWLLGKSEQQELAAEIRLRVEEVAEIVGK